MARGAAGIRGRGGTGRAILAARPFTLVAQDAGAATGRVSFTLRDRFETEWRLGSVPSPVHRVMWLADSLPPGTRAALTRAFNEAAFLGPDARVVRAGPGSSPAATQLAFVP